MTNDINTYHILINEQSGLVSRLGQERLKAVIADSLLQVKKLHILPPEDFFQKLEEIKSSDHYILIGGGDGTVKSAAEIMMHEKKSFGILPMGTMNLLALDLGIPTDIEDALNAYAHKVSVINIDVGMINDQPFLCCVGIGTMPETSQFREDNREQSDAILMPRLTVFMLNQMNSLKHRILRISLDGQNRKLRTAALVISNNQYQPQSERSGNNFKRPSLKEGQLGIYSASPTSLWARIRFMLNLRSGNWRSDPVIDEWGAETVSLKTKNREELISLDGETENAQTPLNFWIEREALPILIPQTIKKVA